MITWQGRKGTAGANDIGILAGVWPTSFKLIKDNELIEFTRADKHFCRGDLACVDYVGFTSEGNELIIRVFND